MQVAAVDLDKLDIIFGKKKPLNLPLFKSLNCVNKPLKSYSFASLLPTAQWDYVNTKLPLLIATAWTLSVTHKETST